MLQYRNLAKHAILEEEYYPAPGYTVLSLCFTYLDDRGRDRLLRCADITEEGEISITPAENAPLNRHLYQNDGPKKKGNYGIWDWTVIPNENDPSRDFIKASFNSKYIPIQVHVVNDCSSTGDLIEQLKFGISLTVTSPRMMFAFFNGAEYEGLFCTAESLEESVGKVYLKQNITALAEFVFSDNDVVHIESTSFNDVVHIEGISFLRFLNTGLPTRVVKVKNPIEITRDIVLRRVTWSVYKQKGFLKNEFRPFRDFIAELPVEDLLGEISSTCDCSQEEAKAYLNDLISEAEAILDGTYPESEVMAQIIRNDDSLIKECQDELRQEWAVKNKALLDAANEELLKIKTEEAELQTIIEKKRKECSSLDARYTTIQEQIQKKQQLAADVEEQVAAKIELARNNAAKFIADNAFIRPLAIESNILPEQHAISYFIDGEYRDESELETNNDWRELLDTIQTELLEAGVAKEKSLGLSGVLYAAYINRTPVLLAGPNSHEIANAFSLALYGCTPASLRCSGDINTEDLQKCQESSADVVVIDNPFEHSWYSSVLEILSLGRRFYMLAHPFAEDLLIEPKGIINYCLPLLTEYYVDSQPSAQYVGGRMTEAFQPLERGPIDDRRCYGPLLRKMQMSLFSIKRVQRILADFDSMLPSKEENDYTFVLNPLAYVLGMTDTLDEYRREHTKEQTIGVL